MKVNNIITLFATITLGVSALPLVLEIVAHRFYAFVIVLLWIAMIGGSVQFYKYIEAYILELDQPSTPYIGLGLICMLLSFVELTSVIDIVFNNSTRFILRDPLVGINIHILVTLGSLGLCLTNLKCLKPAI